MTPARQDVPLRLVGDRLSSVALHVERNAADHPGFRPRRRLCPRRRSPRRRRRTGRTTARGMGGARGAVLPRSGAVRSDHIAFAERFAPIDSTSSSHRSKAPADRAGAQGSRPDHQHRRRLAHRSLVRPGTGQGLDPARHAICRPPAATHCFSAWARRSTRCRTASRRHSDRCGRTTATNTSSARAEHSEGRCRRSDRQSGGDRRRHSSGGDRPSRHRT